MIRRSAKILFVALIGLFGLLTGADNIIDYPTNFEAVRHVLSMDTTHPGNRLLGRAITDENVHRYVYWGILVAEICYGVICIFGALRLVGALRSGAASFDAAKEPAVLGLAIGFALYFFGFMIVGGEWFQMWQSDQWNMQQPAFRFVACFGLVLIFLCQREPDL